MNQSNSNREEWPGEECTTGSELPRAMQCWSAVRQDTARGARARSAAAAASAGSAIRAQAYSRRALGRAAVRPGCMQR